MLKNNSRRGNQSCWNLSSNGGGDDTDTAPSIISNGGRLNSNHPKNPLRAAKSERNITTIKGNFFSNIELLTDERTYEHSRIICILTALLKRILYRAVAEQ